MTPTFSIIVPTVGRPTLERTLASLAPQLAHGDELIVTRRDDAPWGHKSRDEAIQRAAGSHLWFMDDDDIAADGALAAIRAAVEEVPDAVHVFRMRTAEGRVYWGEPVARVGEVGTPMIVAPNVPGKLGQWDGAGYEGDGHFLMSTLAARGDEPVFHEDVVALIRPVAA